MANIVQRIVRNKSPSPSFITSFSNILQPPPIPISVFQCQLQFQLKKSCHVPFFQSTVKEDDPLRVSQIFYPSFRLSLSLDPVLSSRHVETDESKTVWADSVKKKRKKKMNKHKYQKLRKCLRRKSRA